MHRYARKLYFGLAYFRLTEKKSKERKSDMDSPKIWKLTNCILYIREDYIRWNLNIRQVRTTKHITIMKTQILVPNNDKIGVGIGYTLTCKQSKTLFRSIQNRIGSYNLIFYHHDISSKFTVTNKLNPDSYSTENIRNIAKSLSYDRHT